MAVGYPKKINDQKPRLPLINIYHENEYEQNPSILKQQLEEYNEIISTYYQERSQGERQDTWTKQMDNMLSRPRRMYMHEFIKEHRLNTN